MKAFEETTYEESFELPSEYTFKLPKSLSRIAVENTTLIIDPSTSIYITAFNDQQLEIFEEIENGIKLSKLIGKYSEDNDNLHYIIMSLFNSGLNETNNKPKINKENTSLFIYLTDKCNLSCPHCYRSASPTSTKPLSLDDWKKLICDFKNAGGREVTMSGGEPLVSKHFTELCLHIKSESLGLTVLSNGTLWHRLKSKPKELDIVKNIDEIQISIDGYDDLSNKLMRGEGNFEKVVENIEWLTNENSNISIAITPHPKVLFSDEELNKLTTFVEYLANKATVRLSYKILPNESIQLSKEEETRYFEAIKLIEERVYLDSTIKRWVSHYLGYTDKENNCGWGNLTVSEDGDVYTCNRLDASVKLGNVKNTPISTLIQEGQKHRELTSVDNAFPCKSCEIKYLCNGGCRIDEFERLYPTSKRQCNIDKKLKMYRNMVEASKFIYGL